MAFKMKELYNELGEIVEILGDVLGVRMIEESENEYRLYCTTSCYHIPELNVNVHYADLLTFDKETEEYIVADNIFLVFDRDEKKLMYSEQGGSLQTCIHNYYSLILKDRSVTMEKVDNLDCTYVLDRGSILDSYKSYTSIL